MLRLSRGSIWYTPIVGAQQLDRSADRSETCLWPNQDCLGGGDWHDMRSDDEHHADSWSKGVGDAHPESSEEKRLSDRKRSSRTSRWEEACLLTWNRSALGGLRRRVCALAI